MNWLIFNSNFKATAFVQQKLPLLLNLSISGIVALKRSISGAMVVKSTQRKVKLKPGQMLYMSLSMMLLAMLAALALLNVRQMCPELGFIPSLYTTILTFGARRFENALKSGDARTSRTILEDSTRMFAPLVSTLPGEEPKVTRFEVPIGGIGPDRSDTLSGLVYHPNSTARDLGEQRCVAIFIHGGGWILGSIFQSSQRCKDLAKASDMIVVALQYRLAPEFVFPTQINDVQVCSCHFKCTCPPDFVFLSPHIVC